MDENLKEQERFKENEKLNFDDLECIQGGIDTGCGVTNGECTGENSGCKIYRGKCQSTIIISTDPQDPPKAP